MNTLVEPTRQMVTGAEYRKYEVGLIGCGLETGDPVTPATLIGYHYSTQRPVKAAINGRIATIYYNPMHNSLMIMAVSGNS